MPARNPAVNTATTMSDVDMATDQGKKVSCATAVFWYIKTAATAVSANTAIIFAIFILRPFYDVQLPD